MQPNIDIHLELVTQLENLEKDYKVEETPKSYFFFFKGNLGSMG